MTCMMEACGNSTVECTEACDDGNIDNTDACTSTCMNAACGDTYMRTGTETCDDGNTTAGDGCSATCMAETCGDGAINNSPMNETCDDGNIAAGDGCDGSCMTEVSAGMACALSADCTGGLKCCALTCQSVGCCADGDCQTGQLCNLNTMNCYAPDIPAPTTTTTSSTTSGGISTYGITSGIPMPTSGLACITDTTCSPGQKCCANICLTGNCCTDFDCAFGTCQANLCSALTSSGIPFLTSSGIPMPFASSGLPGLTSSGMFPMTSSGGLLPMPGSYSCQWSNVICNNGLTPSCTDPNYSPTCLAGAPTCCLNTLSINKIKAFQYYGGTYMPPPPTYPSPYPTTTYAPAYAPPPPPTFPSPYPTTTFGAPPTGTTLPSPGATLGPTNIDTTQCNVSLLVCRESIITSSGFLGISSSGLFGISSSGLFGISSGGIIGTIHIDKIPPGLKAGFQPNTNFAPGQTFSVYAIDEGDGLSTGSNETRNIQNVKCGLIGNQNIETKESSKQVPRTDQLLLGLGYLFSI